MTTQIVVTLPDETFQRATHLAQLTNRAVAEVLADTLDLLLQPFATGAVVDQPVQGLSDTDLIAATNAYMGAAQDERFSALLNDQQAGHLTDAERSELSILMQVYQEGLLRKAQALSEAVRRGLLPPLEP